MRTVIVLIFWCLGLTGCVGPWDPHNERSVYVAEQHAEAVRRLEDERQKLSQKYVGKEKDEILKACGEPNQKEDHPRYKDADYDERWEYKGGCGFQLWPGHRSETFYFINYRVAEVDLFL